MNEPIINARKRRPRRLLGPAKAVALLCWSSSRSAGVSLSLSSLFSTVLFAAGVGSGSPGRGLREPGHRVGADNMTKMSCAERSQRS